MNVVFGPERLPYAGAIATNHDLTDQIVRVGINYRFGANNEVVVKYP